ncbi:LytTR family DNA-binding domain-containing protein [uncultured Kordia sp.]|uniref:LytR/AlgR family response regulator transcription factor n=1 Tax=uncultured Kordia sp. TaxID=507699 RepID=UPI00261F33AC|nr:LytTR family DNA-binding domain-containing protein [uncultured Kordia sp.]
MKLNCIIIDDEPSSQKVLNVFIEKVPSLHLVEVCNNATDALEALRKYTHIDLLFLDINMPNISGMTFYKSLKNSPAVIFTTAYAEYAIDGFEVNAVDYLLKPFSFDRFLAAVNKAFDAVKTSENTIEEEAIYIKENKTLHKVNLQNILYVEALGDYVKIHLDDKFIVTNSTFTNMLEQLPSNQFIRTHKSFAINFKKLNSVSGNQIIINNTKIPIGQTYKTDFMKLLLKE